MAIVLQTLTCERCRQICISDCMFVICPFVNSAAQTEREAVSGEAGGAGETGSEAEGGGALCSGCSQTPEQRLHGAGGVSAGQTGTM